MRRAAWRRAAIVALALTAFAGIAVALWLHGAFLPRWVRWEYVDEQVNLGAAAGDGAGSNSFALRLEGRRVCVRRGDALVYESPSGWLASSAMTGDVDGDGGDDLIMLMWKRGSYGSSRPFWVEHDELGFSQHIAIYSLVDGSLEPAWVSSALDVDVASMTMDEDRALSLDTAQGETIRVGWLDWGLVLLDDGESPPPASAP